LDNGEFFKCECGCLDFHTFFRYHKIDRERIRCKQCNKTYQRDGISCIEIDLKKLWEAEVGVPFPKQDQVELVKNIEKIL